MGYYHGIDDKKLTNKSVRELELELEQAKKQETLSALEKEMETLIKDFEGKCFGNQTFSRKTTCSWLQAVYYEKFYIEDNKIYVIKHNVSSSNIPSVYKGKARGINYTRYINKECLTNDYSNPRNALYSGFSNTRKEISLEKFTQIYNGGEEAHDLLRKVFATVAPETVIESKYFEGVTGEEHVEKLIEELGLEVVDIMKYPKIERILRYKTLPLFQYQRWIPQSMIVRILKYYAEELRKKYRDSLGNVYSRARTDFLEDAEELENFAKQFSV